MKTFGLISEVDERTIKKTLDLVMKNHIGIVRTLEVGIFDGQTSRGIRDYVLSQGFPSVHTAIDNKRDFDVQSPFPQCNFIVGNSNEVYNQIPDDSMDFIFIDALHTYTAVVSDFFAFKSKVAVGKYMCFHDTGAHLNPLSGWQLVGDEKDIDFCLGSVRKALKEIGLLHNFYHNWRLIFDEADVNDEGGGVVVIQRLK